MSWPTNPDEPEGSPSSPASPTSGPEATETEPPASEPEATETGPPPASPPPIAPRPGDPMAPPLPAAPTGYPPPDAPGAYPPGGPPTAQQPISGGYLVAPPGGQPSGGYPVPGAQPGHPAGGYPSGSYPPPPSGGYPAYAGYPGASRPQPGRKLLVGLVAVLAVGAAAFAAVNLGSGGRSGAASPEDATTEFFESLSDEDLVGMMQMLDPAEREALLPFVEGLESEMSRLALTEDIDLDDVDGLDLEIQGLQVAPVELAPGIAQVDITGGVVTWATEPDAVPIGDALRDIVETNTGEPISIEATADQEPLNGEGEPLFLVATQTGGRWHLSLAFTIAEYARRDAELPMPAESAGVAPQGADSPEAAVQAFVDAVGALDLQRMISLLPPDAMRALQRYAPLFLEDAQESLDEFRDDEGFALTTEELEFDTSTVDGGRRVVPTSGTITIETSDGGMSYSVADGCVTLDGELGEDFESEYGEPGFCTGDMEQLGEDLTPEEREVLGEMGRIFGDMEPGIVAVERDGAWYVDPLRSLGDVTIQLFAGVAPEDLREGGVLFRLFTGDVFDDDVIYGDPGDGSSEGAYDVGYTDGYADGFDDATFADPYDPSGAADVPSDYEGGDAEDYGLGYADGYDDGYVDGEIEAGG